MTLSHPDHAGVSFWGLASYWRRSKSLHSKTIMSKELRGRTLMCPFCYVLGKGLSLFSLNFNFLICELEIVLTS